MTECLDEEAILSFCRGGMAPEGRPAVEAHIAECDECRALVSAVARSSLVDRPAPGGVPPADPTPRLAVDPAMAPTTPAQGGFGPSGIARAASAAPSPSVPVRVGDLLAGKYAVERVLGAGGMGVVVAARHTQLDQRFALKFLLPTACEAPGAVARFLREGKAAARITSEHVARVVDTGVLDDGSPYLVMEYLEGADLGAVGAEKGPLPWAEAVEYVLQACEAIVEAHQLGIVHRDLKPANLFLTRRKDGSPLVKVLDFGISKAEGGSQTQLTSTSMLMGSPRYMSPEQMVSAKDVDARTDVWALGVILFELVAGRPVWHADTVQGLCALIATAPAPALRQHAPDAPAVLEEVVYRCLAKAPAQRIPSIADLAVALAPIAPIAARTSIERILRVGGRAPSAAGGAPDALPAGAAVATMASRPTPQAVSVPSAAAVGPGPAPASSSARFVVLLGAGIAALAIAGVALNAVVLRRDPSEIGSSAASSGAAESASSEASARASSGAAESASSEASARASSESAVEPGTEGTAGALAAPSASALGPDEPSAAAAASSATVKGASRAPTVKGTSQARPRATASASSAEASQATARPSSSAPHPPPDPPNRALSDRK